MKFEGVRYANIGVGVIFVILLVGGFLLRDAGDAALQALGIVAFIVGAAVYVRLDERDKRRRREGNQ